MEKSVCSEIDSTTNKLTYLLNSVGKRDFIWQLFGTLPADSPLDYHCCNYSLITSWIPAHACSWTQQKPGVIWHATCFFPKWFIYLVWLIQAALSAMLAGYRHTTVARKQGLLVFLMAKHFGRSLIDGYLMVHGWWVADVAWESCGGAKRSLECAGGVTVA